MKRQILGFFVILSAAIAPFGAAELAANYVGKNTTSSDEITRRGTYYYRSYGRPYHYRHRYRDNHYYRNRGHYSPRNYYHHRGYYYNYPRYQGYYYGPHHGPQHGVGFELYIGK